MKNGFPPNSSLKSPPSENIMAILERNDILAADNKRLMTDLQVAVDQTASMCERALLAEMALDKIKASLQELNAHVRYDKTFIDLTF